MSQIIASNIEEFLRQQEDPEWRKKTIDHYVTLRIANNYGQSDEKLEDNEHPYEQYKDCLLIPAERQFEAKYRDSQLVVNEHFDIDIIVGTDKETNCFFEKLVDNLANKLYNIQPDIEKDLRDEKLGKASVASKDFKYYFELRLAKGDKFSKVDKGTKRDIAELDRAGFPVPDSNQKFIRIYNAGDTSSDKDIYKRLFNYLKNECVSFVLAGFTGVIAYHVVKPNKGEKQETPP